MVAFLRVSPTDPLDEGGDRNHNECLSAGIALGLQSFSRWQTYLMRIKHLLGQTPERTPIESFSYFTRHLTQISLDKSMACTMDECNMRLTNIGIRSSVYLLYLFPS